MISYNYVMRRKRHFFLLKNDRCMLAQLDENRNRFVYIAEYCDVFEVYSLEALHFNNSLIYRSLW